MGHTLATRSSRPLGVAPEVGRLFARDKSHPGHTSSLGSLISRAAPVKSSVSHSSTNHDKVEARNAVWRPEHESTVRAARAPMKYFRRSAPAAQWIEQPHL